MCSHQTSHGKSSKSGKMHIDATKKEDANRWRILAIIALHTSWSAKDYFSRYIAIATRYATNPIMAAINPADAIPRPMAYGLIFWSLARIACCSSSNRDSALSSFLCKRFSQLTYFASRRSRPSQSKPSRWARSRQGRAGFARRSEPLPASTDLLTDPAPRRAASVGSKASRWWGFEPFSIARHHFDFPGHAGLMPPWQLPAGQDRSSQTGSSPLSKTAPWSISWTHSVMPGTAA